MTEFSVHLKADGSILYNSRAYFKDGKRYLATSTDGGATYHDFHVDDFLLEETEMGCNASFIRVDRTEIRDASLIPKEADGMTVFCNPRSARRENMTVCVSFDGGKAGRWKRPYLTAPPHIPLSSSIPSISDFT